MQTRKAAASFMALLCLMAAPVSAQAGPIPTPFATPWAQAAPAAFGFQPPSLAAAGDPADPMGQLPINPLVGAPQTSPEWTAGATGSPFGAPPYRVEKGVAFVAPFPDITVGGTLTLPMALADDLRPQDLTFTSSEPGIATVDGYGRVTGVSPGDVTITVAAGSYSDSAEVRVVAQVDKPRESGRLSFKHSVFVMSLGDTTSLTFDRPAGRSGIPILWASDDPAIASVDKNGVVRGLSHGVTTITARLEGSKDTATCKVYVLPRDGLYVTLNKDSLTLEPGESETLTATLTPADQANVPVCWLSDDPSIATVDENGRVTGVSPGRVAVVALASMDNPRVCNVLVTDESTPTYISLEPKLLLEKGAQVRLSPTITPQDASDKTLAWSSSNPSVAMATPQNTLITYAPGTAILTATTISGDTAQCEVTVTEDAIYQTKIDRYAVALKPGETQTLAPSLTPALPGAIYTYDTYDENVATVDADGRITAVAPGVTTVTVYHTSHVSAMCKVIVSDSTVPTTVSLDHNTMQIQHGNYELCTATVTPSDAPDERVIWASDNVAVATADNNGRIYGESPGTATLTVMTATGETATCTVTVVP